MATGPLLCVDLGNTRAKATLFPEQDAPRLAFAGPAAELPSSLDPGWAPRLVALSAVSSVEQVVAVRAALEAAFPAAPLVTPDPGLALRVDFPETVGQDRLLAARGALDLLSRSAIVVQVGTCLTVDAVSDAEGGAFLGGAIAPGPDLLARALAEGGARLPAVAPQPDAPALGRDTVRALQAGVAVGLRGAARELVLEVAREAGLEAAPVVLTGGAREFVREGLASLGRSLREDEHLVARGMAAACR
jgi:type III pantothenate kinase